MENKVTYTDAETEEERKIGMLKATLYLLQGHLDEFKYEVDKSYDLLKVGEIKGIADKIKQQLDNPVKALFETSSSIYNEIKHIIEHLVKAFFSANKELISEVRKSKTSVNQLHYSIFLKKDTTENRSKIFTFLDNYDLTGISTKYPIFFQFMPIELKSKINSSEIVELV